ncbi:ketopantoate reductase PanE/ApbA C terminal-domain-containing protein [Phascolomyces articulosus]|uniref:2-dehydropantoate 2-reductase n=1 Tax=Phascolomyces articulosus TaxID=60185 RepID=A0AAD5JZ84_9FUNG|nr:ketopantoate reductase PanE/ApbA C terminal-domain-containing protein [Phascolomyces articulosus]
MRFHIIGVGAIGSHIATELKARNPVTLILRSQKAVQEFRERNQNEITYKRVGMTPRQIPGFDAVGMDDLSSMANIETLVLATKATQAVEAVRSVRSYITPMSTLLLLQNGMGVADEILQSLWPVEEQRPSVVIGVNRHAVERLASFSIQHNSGWNDKAGGLVLGALPHSRQEQVAPVLQALTEIPDMNAEAVDYSELQKRMMRKLVVNAAINPIAGLLDSTNGEMLGNSNAMNLSRNVCYEAAEILTELNTTGEELFQMIHGMLEISKSNRCSTVQDFKAKRLTELEYINGYLGKLAKERNVNAPANQFLLDMIHAKEKMICV